MFDKIRAALAAWLFNVVKCNFNNVVSNKERLCTLWGLHGVRSFRYKVVSIQVDSIPIKVVSRHHQSRFDIPRINSTFMFSTVKWSDRRKNYNLGKPMKILQAPTVIKTLSIRDSFQMLGLCCEFLRFYTANFLCFSG